MSVLPTSIRAPWPLRVRRSGHGARRLIPVVPGHERVLARAESPDVLGSDRALYFAGAPGVWRRIGWGDIASVARSRTALVLQLWPADDSVYDEVRVQTDAAFAAFAAERVASTQVLRRRVPILTGAAMVTAVRPPAEDNVVWRVQVNFDCDRDAPEVRLAIGRVLTELRALSGC